MEYTSLIGGGICRSKEKGYYEVFLSTKIKHIQAITTIWNTDLTVYKNHEQSEKQSKQHMRKELSDRQQAKKQ